MIPRSKMEDVLRRLNDMQHNVNQLEKLAKALSDSIHSGKPVAVTTGYTTVELWDLLFLQQIMALADKNQTALREQMHDLLVSTVEAPVDKDKGQE